jgi:hypothetical protein
MIGVGSNRVTIGMICERSSSAGRRDHCYGKDVPPQERYEQ